MSALYYLAAEISGGGTSTRFKIKSPIDAQCTLLELLEPSSMVWMVGGFR